MHKTRLSQEYGKNSNENARYLLPIANTDRILKKCVQANQFRGEYIKLILPIYNNLIETTLAQYGLLLQSLLLLQLEKEAFDKYCRELENF